MALDLTDLSKTDVVATQKLYAENEILRIDTVNANNLELTNKVIVNEGNQTIGGIKTFSSFPVTPSSAPSSDYQVANKKSVDDIAAAAAASVISFVDTSVFDDVAPNIWTDLDLSGIVGSNKAIVYLKVTITIQSQLVFRTNGDAESIGITTQGLGASGVSMVANGSGYVVVVTDSDGKVEWGSLLDQGGDATVTVRAFAK